MQSDSADCSGEMEAKQFNWIQMKATLIAIKIAIKMPTH